jgi:hypothetical protein
MVLLDGFLSVLNSLPASRVWNAPGCAITETAKSSTTPTEPTSEMFLADGQSGDGVESDGTDGAFIHCNLFAVNSVAKQLRYAQTKPRRRGSIERKSSVIDSQAMRKQRSDYSAQ